MITRLMQVLHQSHVYQFIKDFDVKPHHLSGTLFLAALFLTDALSFGYILFVSQALPLEVFAVISVFGAFLSMFTVITGAVMDTVNYKTAYIEGKNKTHASILFWQNQRRAVIFTGSIGAGLWILATPFIARALQMPVFAVISFALMIPFGLLINVEKGFLSGKLFFLLLSAVLLLEPILKFAITFLLLQIGFPQYAYVAIPLSHIIVVVATVGFLTRKFKKKPRHTSALTLFPRKFFISSVIAGFSTIAFFGLDVMLVAYFLSPLEVGHYALLSFVGKAVFLVGTLPLRLLIPFVARDEGAMKNPIQAFRLLLLLSGMLFAGMYISVLAFGDSVLLFLYGAKAQPILSFLSPMTLAMICFGLAQIFISYHQVRKVYSFIYVSVLFVLLQAVLMIVLHTSIADFVNAVFVTSIINLFVVILMHRYASRVFGFEQHIEDRLSAVVVNIVSKRIPEGVSLQLKRLYGGVVR